MKKIKLRKIGYSAIGVLVLLVIGMAIRYMVRSNMKGNQMVLTEYPFVRNLEDKVLATGTIVPKEEVEVKPNIPGIIDSIYVREGDKVRKGDMIATITVVPNINEMNAALQEIKTAQLQIEQAQINLDNQEIQYRMSESLYEKGVISRKDYADAEQQYKNTNKQLEIAEQQLRIAQRHLEIAKTGITPELRELATTEVRSKLDGTVLEVPVKVGGQVVEVNAFNSGTTIATVADLNTLIFKGKIDEAQAGKLEEGMEMNILVGGLRDRKFPGKLTLIAPRGEDDHGSIKFPVEGNVFNPDSVYIRAGYSANAEIILQSEKDALLLDEALIQYDGDDDLPFVEVKQLDGSFKKVNVELGGSDGINVQIRSGIDKDDEIKVWNPSQQEIEKAKAMGHPKVIKRG